jgi:hypothetical protein
MKPLLLALMVVWAVSSCESDKPKVDEATYVALLTEAALIQSVYNVAYDTVITSTLFEAVLAEYKVDKWVFLESHQVYQRDLEGQERRWKQALDSLTAQSRRLMEP